MKTASHTGAAVTATTTRNHEGADTGGSEPIRAATKYERRRRRRESRCRRRRKSRCVRGRACGRCASTSSPGRRAPRALRSCPAPLRCARSPRWCDSSAHDGFSFAAEASSRPEIRTVRAARERPGATRSASTGSTASPSLPARSGRRALAARAVAAPARAGGRNAGARHCERPARAARPSRATLRRPRGRSRRRACGGCLARRPERQRGEVAQPALHMVLEDGPARVPGSDSAPRGGAPTARGHRRRQRRPPRRSRARVGTRPTRRRPRRSRRDRPRRAPRRRPACPSAGAAARGPRSGLRAAPHAVPAPGPARRRRSCSGRPPQAAPRRRGRCARRAISAASWTSTARGSLPEASGRRWWMST